MARKKIKNFYGTSISEPDGNFNRLDSLMGVIARLLKMLPCSCLQVDQTIHKNKMNAGAIQIWYNVRCGNLK